MIGIGLISGGSEVKKLALFSFLAALVIVPPILRKLYSIPSQSTASATPTVAALEIPFDQMTPAQHLERARSILQDGVLGLSEDQAQELDRHFSAIPKSTPEAAEARMLQKQSIDAAKGKYLERVRAKYASTLEAQLQSQGFDIVVTHLSDKLIVSSDVLKDDAGRIQFLAAVRNSRKDFCNMGYRRVVLSANGVFAGNHTYSLNCK